MFTEGRGIVKDINDTIIMYSKCLQKGGIVKDINDTIIMYSKCLQMLQVYQMLQKKTNKNLSENARNYPKFNYFSFCRYHFP